MREYKQCPNGHYYQGDQCPYCKSHSPKKVITIGSSVDNDCVMNYPRVSCHHCVIFQEKGEYRIADLNSTDGTYVNGVLITECTLLNPLDNIVIGGQSVNGWLSHFGGGLRSHPKGGDFQLTGIIEEPENDNNKDAADIIIETDDQSVFKKCPHGYYFRGNYCPYCKTPSLNYGHNVFQSSPNTDGVAVYHVKVCPDGHGYDVGLQACPFCGSDKVATSIKCRAGFTSAIIDLQFEENGVPVSYKATEVDGRRLAGETCMRIEYTGVFKYAYYVASKGKIEGGLIINPKSYITLMGDGSTKTLTGLYFYKMCDMAFEKEERNKHKNI